jgi:hypothetical protein
MEGIHNVISRQSDDKWIARLLNGDSIGGGALVGLGLCCGQYMGKAASNPILVQNTIASLYSYSSVAIAGCAIVQYLGAF